MDKPNVQLKKVKTFIGMDGYGLNADVYINGVHCYSYSMKVAVVKWISLVKQGTPQTLQKGN